MIITKLSEYFDDWDPMGFITDLDAPKGEYATEAAEVYLKVKKTMTLVQIADIVHNIFVSSIEIDPDGFSEECKKRAADIRHILFDHS